MLNMPYVWVSPEGRPVPGSVYFRAVIRLLGHHQEELLELIADEKERSRSGAMAPIPNPHPFNLG